jgi:hypothetical protein
MQDSRHGRSAISRSSARGDFEAVRNGPNNSTGSRCFRPSQLDEPEAIYTYPTKHGQIRKLEMESRRLRWLTLRIPHQQRLSMERGRLPSRSTAQSNHNDAWSRNIRSRKKQAGAGGSCIYRIWRRNYQGGEKKSPYKKSKVRCLAPESIISLPGSERSTVQPARG